MSSFFDGASVTTEPIKTAKLLLIIGKPDTGKSYLASFAKKPFFLATEKGCELVQNNIGRFLISDELGNERLKLPLDIDEFFEAFQMIVKNKGKIKGIQYKTIVIDGAKFTQELFSNDTLKHYPSREEKGKTLENISADEIPFGVNAKRSVAHWEKVMYGVSQLLNSGIGVIIICHSHDKAEDTPDGKRPKRSKIDLPAWSDFSVPNMIMARADCAYHMRKEIRTRVITNDFGGKGKTVPVEGGTPDVVVWTRQTNALDAKCKVLNHKDIPDCYVIDINRPETSQVIFDDLLK